MKTKIFCLIGVILFASVLSAWEESEIYRKRRDAMVKTTIKARGIREKSVLEAMIKIPRHFFVPDVLKNSAYHDYPLPIGEGQTISQPYIVALMTVSLNLKPGDRVLEIGTGSGYQAAVLSCLVKEVYTIEIKEKLHIISSRTLKDMGFENIQTRHGDGYFGWEDAQPFDHIMITAAVNHIPPPLLKQLKDGGTIILPLGDPFAFQNLVLITKENDDYTVKHITGVLFVPMTGKAMDR